MTGADVQVAGLVFGVTAAVTMGMLKASQRWHLMDVPNERSAHEIPTPTVGGVGISAGIAAGVLTAPVPGDWGWPLLVALAILLVAVVDDLVRPLAVSRKLLLQLAAAGAWVALAPSMPIQLTAHWSLAAGPAAAVFTVLWLMWLMNMFNFMDGIDGLAITQTAAMGSGLALVLATTNSPLVSVPLILIAACLGFLLFNAPPARIFMADVGSLSLGFLVGTITLAAAGQGTPLWLSAMPLTAFFVDTSYTICRRFQHGENILRAHNQHLYQRLVQAGWSHQRVVVAAFAVTGLFSAAAVFGVRGLHGLAGGCGGAAALALMAGLWWKERRRSV